MSVSGVMVLELLCWVQLSSFQVAWLHTVAYIFWLAFLGSVHKGYSWAAAVFRLV